MADVTFGHRAGQTPPATMNHPGQWHYVATRLMAHMGAYSPDENERTTLAMAPARSPARPCDHARAQHLGHPWISGLPKACLRPPAAAVPARPEAAEAGGAP